VLLAGCSSDTDPAPAAAPPPSSSTSTPSSSVPTTSTTVAPPTSITHERLVDACQAEGQNGAVPLKLFGVAAQGGPAVEVRWDAADLADGPFATQRVVTGSGTAKQASATKLFTYSCTVSAGASPSVVSFDVTPR